MNLANLAYASQRQRPLSLHNQIWLSLILLLGFASSSASAMTNGKWNANLNCSAREDLAPVRPGFSVALPQLTVSGGSFSSSRTYREPNNTVTEEWRGQVTPGGIVATAMARRDNGDAWNYEVRGSNSESTSIQLQGFMSSNGQRVRKCTLELTLADADSSQPRPVAASPATTIPNGQAGSPQVTVGVQSNVSLRLKLDNSVSRCNIEVNSPGIGTREFEVTGPNFELQVPVLANQAGSLPIQWRGKARVRGINTVQACPGSGNMTVFARVGDDPTRVDQTRAKWAALLNRLTQEQSECLRFGIAHRSLRIDSIDPAAVLTSPDSPEAKLVFAKCDAFLALRLRTDYECSVPNNIRARCDEQFARELDGRPVAIRREEAMRAHFDDQPLRVSGFETAASIEARKQADLQQKQADDRRREQEANARAAAAARSTARSAQSAPASPPTPAPRPVRGE